MRLWGFDLDDAQLSGDDRAYLAALPDQLPTVEWVWAELDRVWYALRLDNRRPLSEQAESVSAFYSHPVWTMNGVFSATDPVSQGHRRAIAAYLADTGLQEIADYGGGFGQLAMEIVDSAEDVRVTVVEPYASDAAHERFASLASVDLMTSMMGREFDVMIAQDVLEHVDDPIGLAIDMSRHVRVGGRLVFANHFRPSIACHLPSTFHLLFTFPWVMRALGLRFRGVVDGAAHAQVFEVVGSLRPRRVRVAERASRIVAPIIGRAWQVLPASVRSFLKSRR